MCVCMCVCLFPVTDYRLLFFGLWSALDKNTGELGLGWEQGGSGEGCCPEGEDNPSGDRTEPPPPPPDMYPQTLTPRTHTPFKCPIWFMC